LVFGGGVRAVKRNIFLVWGFDGLEKEVLGADIEWEDPIARHFP